MSDEKTPLTKDQKFMLNGMLAAGAALLVILLGRLAYDLWRMT